MPIAELRLMLGIKDHDNRDVWINLDAKRRPDPISDNPGIIWLLRPPEEAQGGADLGRQH